MANLYLTVCLFAKTKSMVWNAVDPASNAHGIQYLACGYVIKIQIIVTQLVPGWQGGMSACRSFPASLQVTSYTNIGISSMVRCAEVCGVLSTLLVVDELLGDCCYACCYGKGWSSVTRVVMWEDTLNLVCAALDVPSKDSPGLLESAVITCCTIIEISSLVSERVGSVCMWWVVRFPAVGALLLGADWQWAWEKLVVHFCFGIFDLI